MRAILFSLILLTFSLPAFAAEKTAVFAGGCFWCMESEYEDLDGVSDVQSGFTGGSAETATYEAVSSGTTDHREAIQITYDPDKVSYERLLKIFWSNVDPFDDEGQFCDKGTQYTAAIYVHDKAERTLAEESLKKIEEKYDQKVVTDIAEASAFYPAENYHQDYAEKNPLRYKFYRGRCGRDGRLQQLSVE